MEKNDQIGKKEKEDLKQLEMESLQGIILDANGNESKGNSDKSEGKLEVKDQFF